MQQRMMLERAQPLNMTPSPLLLGTIFSGPILRHEGSEDEFKSLSKKKEF